MDHLAVKHFIEILVLKKTDVESIYSVLINWLNMKNVQSHKLVQQIVDVWNRKLLFNDFCFIVAS